MAKPYCIVLSGMTGTGKSKLARSLARSINGQIICGDSVQLIDGLPTLTNKSFEEPLPLLQSHFTYKDRLDAHMYTKTARKEILNVIQNGKVPIIEGGSWFYIRHLFTGLTDVFEDEQAYEKAQKDAQRIIETDKYDFEKTYDRVKKLAVNLNYESEVGKLNLNDWYRLEQKFTQIMYLASKKLTYCQLLQSCQNRPEYQLFVNMPRMYFFLTQPRSSLYPVLDQRVDQMLLNENFWPDIAMYAQDLNFALENEELSKEELGKDALFRSIGFIESLEFIKDLKECKKPQVYRSDTKKVVERYLHQFKTRTRGYAAYQFKTARSHNITKSTIQSCDKYMMVSQQTSEKDILECVELGPEKMHLSKAYGQQEELMAIDSQSIKELNTYKSKHTLSKEQTLQFVIKPALRVHLPEMFM